MEPGSALAYGLSTKPSPYSVTEDQPIGRKCVLPISK